MNTTAFSMYEGRVDQCSWALSSVDRGLFTYEGEVGRSVYDDVFRRDCLAAEMHLTLCSSLP